jgi:aminoglycoside phosphotransferase family enzyme/predicted kinase
MTRMELLQLIDALSQPAAYPFAVRSVEVHQTHISMVFLAGSFAYKIKKPVSLGFLDFSTLETRRHFCEAEVQLNRRLAGDVYHGLVPITKSADRLHVEGTGEIVEWAVKMERLPDEANLEHRLRRGELDKETLEKLAQTIAAFHAQAPTSESIAAFGKLAIVAENARENLLGMASHVGQTVSASVIERLRARTEKMLTEVGPLIDQRAQTGVPRDTHGDLRLEHVYFFPDRPQPRDLVIIDCIEFNDRFRYSDPVADMAFLYMDLLFQGRRDLAEALAESYFHHAGDVEGRKLLPFYTAYRALVRAKVEGIAQGEPELPRPECERALQRARAHGLLALTQLEEPQFCPCIVLIGGLPGSGKSTLARGLADRHGFQVIRSDVLRKELWNAEPRPQGAELYGDSWNDRAYGECARRAANLLFQGSRVVIDATFRAEHRRTQFLELAMQWGVPTVLFVCDVQPNVAHQRLIARHGDVSDADWSVYLSQQWDAPGTATSRALVVLDANGPPPVVLDAATATLRRLGLLGTL